MDRTDQIAAVIRKEAARILPHTTAVSALNAQRKAESEAATTMRETVILALAGIANAEAWSHDEVVDGCATAAMLSDARTEASVMTFLGELKRALHPMVRPHVKSMVKARDEAWAIETDHIEACKRSKATPDKPLRKAFARSYHVLMAMCSHAADNGVVLTTSADIVAYARKKDPDLDASKVQARLERIVKELGDCYANFPYEDLETAKRFISGISAMDLVKARTARANQMAHARAGTPTPNGTAEVLTAARAEQAITTTTTVTGNDLGTPSLDELISAAA
jgi:hypothetical protein